MTAVPYPSAREESQKTAVVLTARPRLGPYTLTAVPVYGTAAIPRAEQREFKAALAVRENYRCALTQAFDLNRVVFLKKCGRGSEIPSGAAVLSMHAAHIIPLSLNSFSEMGERQAAGTVDFKDAAVTSAMLQSWTNIDLDGLVGPKITTLQNGIYMTRDNHIGFGHFKIYLEADPVVPNQYEARCYDMLLTDGSETRIVNFNTPEPPSPQLIGIHAAFARVLHLSGAADHHEDLERDAERMEVLYSQGLIDIGQALPSQLAVLGGGVVYVRPQVAY